MSEAVCQKRLGFSHFDAIARQRYPSAIWQDENSTFLRKSQLYFLGSAGASRLSKSFSFFYTPQWKARFNSKQENVFLNTTTEIKRSKGVTDLGDESLACCRTTSSHPLPIPTHIKKKEWSFFFCLSCYRMTTFPWMGGQSIQAAG